jgi:colanic acid/amylovoran biosynthesis glycosyltransferase
VNARERRLGGPQQRARIGHVVARYLRRSETFVYTQLRSLRTFQPVVLAGRVDDLDEFPFSPVHELLPSTSGLRRVSWKIGSALGRYRSVFEYRLTRAAKSAHCVALHAHFGWMGRLCLDAQARLGIPLITRFYGRDLLDESFMHEEIVWTERDERLYSQGTLFVCEGPQMAAKLAAIGCPPEKIRVVRLGIELDAFPYAPRERRSPIVVVQVARFVEKKGIDLSIRAFAKARQRLGPSELWLIGDGELRPSLEGLAHELDVSGHVRFLGMVPAPRVRELLRQATVAIQPSRTASDGDTEGGAPTVLLELQASGIPVVSTRHADIPFVVPNPEQLADEEDADGLADALANLVQLPGAEWTARCEVGRAFVEQEHDAAVAARHLEGVYLEALRIAGIDHLSAAADG